MTKRATLEAMVRGAPAALPSEYLAYVTASDAAEGPLSCEPGWLQLWPVGDVLSLNDAYGVTDYWPDYFAFGSDGGGELLLFERIATGYGPIIMVPFIPFDPSVRVRVCSSFATLLEHFGASGAPSN